MKTLSTIETLSNEVKLASTSESKGRQTVANSCKELYNIIEETLYNKYGEDAILDAHNDLLNSDFAEPFHCEKNKEKFNLYARIYTNIISK